jgi:hypothetical protein
MSKRKRTAADKTDKQRRKLEYQTIFVRGKMKRVRRPPTIEGMEVEEFIRANADPIWLHQNELWEYMEQEPLDDETMNSSQARHDTTGQSKDEDEDPFS